MSGSPSAVTLESSPLNQKSDKDKGWTKKSYRYQPEIQQMLFVFGHPDAPTDTTELIECIVRQQIINAVLFSLIERLYRLTRSAKDDARGH